MASETHVRHRFVELAGDYKLIKEIIGKEKEEFLNFIYPYYEEVAIDLENQTANLDKEYEKLTTEIPKQGDLWHSEIDIIINKMKVEIGEIKVKHKDILQKHMNDIKQTQSLIKRTIIALEEFEKSNEVYSIIKYSSKIREFRKVLPKIKVSLPTFIPKQIDGTKLYSLFGHITSLSTVTEKNVLSLNQPVKELLDEPQLIATMQTGFKKLRSVVCQNEDQIWTSGLINDIICFNMTGLILQTIQTKSDACPFDIAVDSYGGVLYSDLPSRSVYKVKMDENKS